MNVRVQGDNDDMKVGLDPAASQLVTDQDLQVAEALLRRFCVGGDLHKHVNQQRFKELRRAGNAFFTAMAGKQRRDNASAKEKNMLAGRRNELRKLDRQHIRNTEIRRRRIAQLAALQTDQSRLLIGLPGSCSDDHRMSSALIEAAKNNGEAAELEDQSADPNISILYNELAQKGELFYHRGCYVCKARFVKLHHFYSDLCPSCAELNWSKRNATADLRGKIILLTGSRVKIGFECGLKLLRCGATVVATSRFPHDCARRYAEQSDSSEWKDRLHVFGIDLRDLKAVVRFTDLLRRRYTHLDAIINNAAQTVRRPPIFYRHLLQAEAVPLSPELSAIVQEDVHMQSIEGSQSADEVDTVQKALAVPLQDISSSATLSQMTVIAEDMNADTALFPSGNLDVNGQQVDLRKKNSWTMLLDEIEPAEIVEVFAVNALSPFIICSRLKPLLVNAGADCDKFIVNVSAMEGKFYRFKGPQHPHTNMAKSALNQLVRTSSQDYARDRIYMNAVDTGWINDENPFDVCVDNANRHWQTPIDEVDAMARVLDPIISGFSGGDIVYGKFLKDFFETEW